MKKLTMHWFDFGGLVALVLLCFILFNYWHLSVLRIILLLSFVSLLLHQVEEYRFPGYFPGMLNRALYKSSNPDRFPLNAKSAFIINVCLGWSVYFLAAFFAEKVLWIAIASFMISIGNIVAHTILFNIKGKTFYNPGMLTSLLLFLPISIYFFLYIQQYNLSHPIDYIVGISIGILLNYLGVIKLIDILKDKNTHFIFGKRFIQK